MAVKKELDPFIENQWKEWQDTNPLDKIPNIDTDTLRDVVIKDLSFVSVMNVKEYTLYQKWCEVHQKYPTIETNSFFDDRPALVDPEQGSIIQEVKNNFWNPEDPMEYLNLEPELIYTDFENEGKVGSVTGKKLPAIWNTLRTFLSTMKNNSNIGRNLYFIIRDKKTEKYLGVGTFVCRKHIINIALWFFEYW